MWLLDSNSGVDIRSRARDCRGGARPPEEPLFAFRETRGLIAITPGGGRACPRSVPRYDICPDSQGTSRGTRRPARHEPAFEPGSREKAPFRLEHAVVVATTHRPCLRRAIEFIRAQSVAPKTIFVVVDRDEPTRAAVEAELATVHKGIEVIRNDRMQGASGAWTRRSISSRAARRLEYVFVFSSRRRRAAGGGSPGGDPLLRRRAGPRWWRRPSSVTIRTLRTARSCTPRRRWSTGTFCAATRESRGRISRRAFRRRWSRHVRRGAPGAARIATWASGSPTSTRATRESVRGEFTTTRQARTG